MIKSLEIHAERLLISDVAQRSLIAQRALMVPLADGLRDRLAAATGFDCTLLLWRYETASATVRFLDALVLTPPSPSART